MNNLEELINDLADNLFDAEDSVQQLASPIFGLTEQERIAIAIELCSRIQAYAEQYRRDFESLQQAD